MAWPWMTTSTASGIKFRSSGMFPEGDPKEFKPQSDNIHSELYFVDSSEMLLSPLLLGDVIIPEGALRV